MRRLFSYPAICAALLLLGAAGCPPPGQADEPVSLRQVTFKDHSYLVVEVHVDKAKLRLYWKKPDGAHIGTLVTLKSWLESQGEQLLFATNAGIFRPGHIPGGLHIEEGKELVGLNLRDGAGNFHLKPNGVFYLKADGAHIVTSEAYDEPAEEVLLATQSGPMLVIDGELHPAFHEDSESLKIRNAVGVKAPDEVYFVLSREGVSFHEMASLFRDVLGCPNALYLDGELSAFYMPGKIENLGLIQYAGMLAVTTPKPQEETSGSDRRITPPGEPSRSPR